MRRARRAKARREWALRSGHVPATVPMWLSRATWVDGLRRWATDAVVRAVCARLGCSITSATLVAIAVVMAERADHADGRHMTATRAYIAQRVGCSSRTVTTAWRVLSETGWAVEAARGHGGPGVPGFGRRASVWHLTPRRETAASVEFFHLPTPLGVGSLSLVGKNSPSARSGARRGDRAQKTKQRYRAEAAPRPLALQRLAADLVSQVRSLDRGHIGALCDALATAGIDPQVWTGRQIRDALNADMRQSGWSWPDRIERPGGFLVSRLRRLTRGGTAAGLDQGQAGSSTPTPPAYVAEPHRPLTADQRAKIGQIQAEIRGRLAARRTQQGRSWPATARRVGFSPAPVPHSGTCAHCGAPQAPARPFLPLSRARVCDPCWGQQ
ncbi:MULTISPECIES: rep protein [unclassified Mycolicibacterium]|uniref:rep protein n=1 Tax=unclassified Mycolicibacterium TaxID=2636767 RepID=UPI00192E58C6|nr:MULTISPECIES: rep protein [unclassified Mycolicibacterium]